MIPLYFITIMSINNLHPNYFFLYNKGGREIWPKSINFVQKLKDNSKMLCKILCTKQLSDIF